MHVTIELISCGETASSSAQSFDVTSY